MDALTPDLFDQTPTYDAAGAAACLALAGGERRQQGITLTPEWLVDLMLDRLAQQGHFDNIVDAGAGSGRFCIRAARLFPQARIWAIERSAAMCAALRANLAMEGLSCRVTVVQGDFRDVPLAWQGRTAFIGNPPFVRHHDIEPSWKRWYAGAMADWGIKATQLAGLHLHFMTRIAQLAQPGDHVCLVTSAEWLDNGYGSAWRSLLGAPAQPLALAGLWVAPPDAPVFPDALVSAVVLEARCGRGIADVEVELGTLAGRSLHTARRLLRAELDRATRWTALCQTDLDAPAEGVELGELFRVTRGQVTGLNEAWVLPLGSNLLPASLTVPAVTKAREVIDGTVEATDALDRLRHVASLPVDLSTLCAEERLRVDQFLELARSKGAAQGYVAQQRRAWHALDLRAAPQAFVSYMGRRPPVFRSNPHGVSYLNIAHGLYARQAMADAQLLRLLDHLNRHTRMGEGRVYGGGMAKFEPSDISRLRIPVPVLAGQP